MDEEKQKLEATHENEVDQEKDSQDFFQKVLHSFEEDYDENERETKQEKWKKFNSRPSKEMEHNDFPNYFFAGFWMRLFAYTIDIICVHAVSNIFLGMLFFVLKIDKSTEFLSFYGLSYLIIYVGYFTLLTKLNQGQTVGKMIFGIRVISFTEEELSWSTVLVRETACRFFLQAQPLLMFGYLPSAFTSKKQHVGDYFSDTSVVTLNMIQAFNQQNHA